MSHFLHEVENKIHENCASDSLAMNTVLYRRKTQKPTKAWHAATNVDR